MDQKYNPASNYYIYQDLIALQKSGDISHLTRNAEAYENDLFITFNLTQNSLNGIDHSFNLKKYLLRLVRSKEIYTPEIYIDYPIINSKAHHIFQNKKSLCLFHPDDYKWNEDISIRKEIIPWAFMWIYFYEVWLRTGEWLGPEHPKSKQINLF